MLYDPKWEQKTETKPDPLKIETLIAWLEKQPADSTYDYYNCRGDCMVGRYMADHGVEWNDFKYCREWAHFGKIAADGTGSSQKTFGGALERARAFASA